VITEITNNNNLVFRDPQKVHVTNAHAVNSSSAGRDEFLGFTD
jgi:hypothetical protein